MGLSFAAPLAGRDDWEQPESTNPYKFQSTRPLRGATYAAFCQRGIGEISILAPLAGRDGKSDEFSPADLRK